MSHRREQEDWTILLIDDEKDLVELLVYHLEKKGFKIITARDG